MRREVIRQFDDVIDGRRCIINEVYLDIYHYYAAYAIVPEMPDVTELDVHGGIAYAGNTIPGDPHEDLATGWCIGFDTSHLGDDLDTWPLDKVKDELKRFVSQINLQEEINENH